MAKEFSYDEHRTMLLDRCIRAVACENFAKIDESIALDPTVDAASIERLRQYYVAMVKRLSDWIKPTEREATEHLLKAIGFNVPPDDHAYWKALGL